jgi:hypothetical protein
LQLPDVLADQTPLTVIRTDGVSLTVQDVQGREWILQHWLVDCGFEFFLQGHWLHESDPAVLCEIERMLGVGGTTATSPEESRYQEWLRSILHRHGHGPESRS